jgi:hypothetical protein
MKDDVPALVVLAIFGDRIAAEIACALLADASIRSDEPEAAADGTWSIELRGVSPDLSARAEVILRSARARETRIVADERQKAA